MDEIRIEQLEVYAYHGVYPEETKKGQIFQVNATLYTNTREAGIRDDLSLSTNYGEVCLFIDSWMRNNTCKLLEAVAERLSRALLVQFPLVFSLDLEIKKPDAPIDLIFDSVSVKIHRGWHRVYLSVGSNMGDRRAYIEGAVEKLRKVETIRTGRISKLIETKPYGGVEQENFLNGVIELETFLTPGELLAVLHEIENAAGRERLIHWGPRTLDLDILLFDDLVYESDTLIIPHPDMKNRAFVLDPLCELIPFAEHPVYHKSIRRLKEELDATIGKETAK